MRSKLSFNFKLPEETYEFNAITNAVQMKSDISTFYESVIRHRIKYTNEESIDLGAIKDLYMETFSKYMGDD